MNQTPETSLKPLLGIVLKITSIVLLVSMMVALKFAIQTTPVGQIIFFRAIIGVATIYVFFSFNSKNNGGTAHLRIQSYKKHLPWALSSAAAMTMWFVALALIPLPEATAIGFVMPLLVVALAWALLGEKIRLIRSVAIGLGLVGVLIIVWPRLGTGADYSSAPAIGAALSLTAAALWAFAQICLRTLSKTESSASAVISFSIATMVIGLFTLPLSGLIPGLGWTLPNATGWFWLITCGVAGGLGQLATAESLRFATPATLAPLEYMAFPIASLAAIIFFGEHPDSNIWKGLPFVIAGGLLVILREYQLKHHRA